MLTTTARKFDKFCIVPSACEHAYHKRHRQQERLMSFIFNYPLLTRFY